MKALVILYLALPGIRPLPLASFTGGGDVSIAIHMCEILQAQIPQSVCTVPP